MDASLTSLAFCWTIERSDGAGLALTSHDMPVTAGGVAYEPAPGMLPAAVQRISGMDADDAEVAGAVSSEALEEADLAAGRWDGARVRLTAVDWAQPAAEPTVLTAGELGEVRLEGREFHAGLRGAAARLEQTICPETSPECRAELGDKQCRIDMAGRSVLVRVGNNDGAVLVLDQAVGSDFLWGRARFLSGANCGLVTAVTFVDGNRIELRDRARAAIVAGDWLELRHGCDKRFATCCDRFGNAANFRGEPHLPGNDLLIRFPGA